MRLRPGVVTSVVVWGVLLVCVGAVVAVCVGFGFASSEAGRANHPLLTRMATVVGVLILGAVAGWFTYGMGKGVRDTWWLRLRGVTLDATVRGVRVVPRGGEDPDEHYAVIDLTPADGGPARSLEIRTFPGDRAVVGATVRVRHLAAAPRLTRVIRPTVGRFLGVVIADGFLLFGLVGGAGMCVVLAYLAFRVATN